jgi:hypothetical protein
MYLYDASNFLLRSKRVFVYDAAGIDFHVPLLKFALYALLLRRFSYQHDAKLRYGFVAT